MRVYCISDIHIDFEENARWIAEISDSDFLGDALILAGDVAHEELLLQQSLRSLKTKFRRLFFVPGNHDLWVHNSDWTDSIEKFHSLLDWCRAEGIDVAPRLLDSGGRAPVWVVPLFSWYSASIEDSHSLYWPKPGEDKENRSWADNHYIRWPGTQENFDAASFFAAFNTLGLQQTERFPVISFSHFLPRQEMMFGDRFKPDPEKIRKFDRNPKFNFSRVAGSTLIEQQIRQLGSQIHVYGHQHINRDRVLEGVRYIAHCLSYPAERKRGMAKGIEGGLKKIWDTGKPVSRNMIKAT